MTLYLLLGLLLFGTIAASFTAPFSFVRVVRFLLVFAVYPLFVAIALRRGVGHAGVVWLGLAETFSRDVHHGGLAQWFSRSDSSVAETVHALQAVGAAEAAAVLLRASKTSLSTLDDRLFSVARREDLTTLNAGFARRNRSRCPALNGKTRQAV